MRLGFIGTGGITTAIVTGLCTSDNPPETIWVSPRNSEKATQLKSAYDRVQVGKENQEVLDHCDVVFLAVLPQSKEEILAPLTFREEHIVVHLLAGTTVEQIQPLVKPAKSIVRAVPLPCTAIHVGPIAMYPDHALIADLFDGLGTVIALDQESQLETLSVITALMAPYYAFLEKVTAWGEGEGIDRKDAATYTASMFGALSVIAEFLEDGDLPNLKTECMTPGGLNEMAMEIIDGLGEFDNLLPALDAVKQRIG